MKKMDFKDFQKLTNLYTEDIYRMRKADFIANYKVFEPGLLGGNYKHHPEYGEMRWKDLYPNGYQDWVMGEYPALKYFFGIINGLIEEVETLKTQRPITISIATPPIENSGEENL